MQTPSLLSDGLSARMFKGQVLAVIFGGALWLGCGGGDEGTGDGNSSSQAPVLPAPVTVVEAPDTDGEPAQTYPVLAYLQEEALPEVGGALPANAKYIPANPTMLFSLKIGAMMEKGGYAELIKSPLFKEALAEVGDEAMMALIQNPAKSGLDVTQPMHVHITMKAPEEEAALAAPTLIGGFVASIKNPEALRATLNLMVQGAGLPIKETKMKGYTMLAPDFGPDQPAPMVIGYSKDTLISSFGIEGNVNAAANLAAQFSGKNSVAPNSKAGKLLQKKYDVAVWMDYAKVMNMVMENAPLDGPDLPFGDLLGEQMKDMGYAFAINFDAGAVKLDATYHYNKELYDGKLAKGGLDKNLLQLVPNNSAMAGAQAINMKTMRNSMKKHVMPLLNEMLGEEMLAEIENSIGMKIDDVMTVPKGDFLLVFEGLKMPENEFETPEPQMLLGMTIDNKDNFNKLLNHPSVQGVLPALGAYGVQVAQGKGDTFYICSRNHVPAINAGKTPKPANARHLAMLGGNDFAGYIQFDAVRKMVIDLGGDGPEVAMMAGMMGKLEEAAFHGKFGKAGQQDLKMALTFKDKKTNGLKQLVDFVMQFGNQFAGIGGAGAPEAEAFEIERELLRQDR